MTVGAMLPCHPKGGPLASGWRQAQPSAQQPGEEPPGLATIF